MTDNHHSFTRAEIGPVIVVSLISALRLLGIFLILPVFSVYAVHYPEASLAMAGIAFGAYALTQSILQIPLGWASDRWGRKPILLIGLALFLTMFIMAPVGAQINEAAVAPAMAGQVTVTEAL